MSERTGDLVGNDKMEEHGFRVLARPWPDGEAAEGWRLVMHSVSGVHLETVFDRSDWVGLRDLCAEVVRRIDAEAGDG